MAPLVPLVTLMGVLPRLRACVKLFHGVSLFVSQNFLNFVLFVQCFDISVSILCKKFVSVQNNSYHM